MQQSQNSVRDIGILVFIERIALRIVWSAAGIGISYFVRADAISREDYPRPTISRAILTNRSIVGVVSPVRHVIPVSRIGAVPARST